MRRATYVWTVLAIALVAMLAVACEQPINPNPPQNTATPTNVGDFPPDYTPPAPLPTPPTGTEPKATTPPSDVTREAPTVQPVVTTAPVQPTTAAPATAVPQPTTAPQPTAGTGAGTTGETLYTVQPGDTLFRISLAYGLSWQTVAAYNGITNPNAIYVGQVIKIPAATGTSPTPVPGGSKTYVVQPGDNLFRISLAYGLSYLTVAQYNGIAWPYWVYPGQVIRIP